MLQKRARSAQMDFLAHFEKCKQEVYIPDRHRQ